MVQQRQEKRGPPANDAISADPLRVIDDKGENLGVIALPQARNLASQANLDLVLVATNTEPPVARILDLGKYKYEQQKKRSQSRRNQKVISLKEIKFRPNIEQHDYMIKMRAIRKFLTAGDKVKVTLRFRGREMAYTKPGIDLINRVISENSDIAQVEQEPQFEGRQFLTILGRKTS